jgi:hypothetical protein
MNMKLRAIALIALMSVLTFAANAQATRADLPAPDNFLGIATFPLWDGDAPGALGPAPHFQLTINFRIVGHPEVGRKWAWGTPIRLLADQARRVSISGLVVNRAGIS